MGPSSSTDRPTSSGDDPPTVEATGDRPIEGADIDLLIDVADGAICDGLAGRPPTLPDPDAMPAPLRRRAATFVTLHVDGELNGCIGSIDVTEPVSTGAARHAWSAAFDDPRLPPLRVGDYERLTIEVSVLSALVPTAASTSSELMESVRPGVDGLLIEAGRRRGVFLPSVWATLTTPRRFVAELFVKAGLDEARWHTDLRAWTFTADKVSGAPRPGGPATVR